MKRLICGLFTAIGLLCALFPRQITEVLPYLLGGSMAAAGVLYGISHFRSRETRTACTPELADSLVMLSVGTLGLFRGAESTGLLEAVWALIGLQKAAQSLSRIVQSRGKGMAFYTSFAEFLVRLTFSVMLLIYPAVKAEARTVLLGLELIAVSIRLTRQISLVLDAGE